MCMYSKKVILFQKWWCDIINDLLTELSVRTRNTKLSLWLTILASSGRTKKIGLRISRALQNTDGALSYVARWENWYATGNFEQERLWGSSVVKRLDSESIFQQQFGEYNGDDGCYSITFDSSTMVRLSELLQKFSNDNTWAYWCIILRKRAGTDKMDYRWFRRKYLLGCLGKLGEVSKQQQVIE